MILYQLKCSQGHDFEVWFLNGAAYDSQQASGDVGCPFCGTTEVSKAIMAPNISPGGSSLRNSGPSEERAQQVAEKILDAVDGLREHVEENCDYVGDEFAEEARRIHYGDDDGDDDDDGNDGDDGDGDSEGQGQERGIYGKATDEEAEDLEEEGINFFRLPFVRRRGR